MNATKVFLSVCLFCLLRINEGSPVPFLKSCKRLSVCLNGPSWKEKACQDGSREYRLEFFVPGEWNDGRVVGLRFNSINYLAQIQLNGKSADAIEGSFIRHFVDITPYFQAGEKNLLEVRITGSPPDDRVHFTQGYRWKNYSTGILGDVYLECYPRLHVDNTFVQTSVRKNSLSTVTWLANDTGKTVNADLVQDVFDGDRKILSLPRVKVTLEAGDGGNYRAETPWKNPVLWGYGDYGRPKLYRLRTTVVRNGVTEDVYYTRFGFREFRIEGKKLYLNGREIFIGHGLLGPTMGNHRSYLTRLYQAFRSINLNGVRYSLENSGNSSTPFDVADELGMFVKPQMFLGGTGPGWGHGKLATPEEFAELSEIYTENVKRLWNHPSILWWVIDNENASTGNAGVWKQLRELRNVVKKLDPSRPAEHGGDRILALAKHQGIYPDLEMWSTRPGISTMLREMQEYKYDGTIPIIQDEIYPPATFVDDGTPLAYHLAYPEIVSRVFSGIADLAFSEITGHHRLGAASAGLCVGLGTYFSGIKGDGKVQFPWDIKTSGTKISVRWPSHSGKDQEVPYVSFSASQIIPNWFDPAQPVVLKSIVAEKTKEAYRTINNGKDLPSFTGQRPEAVITLSDGKGPLPGRTVILLPGENLPCGAEGAITDSEGTAWFSPDLPGTYGVCWDAGAEWKCTSINIAQKPFNPEPGYTHIQWFDLGPMKISEKIRTGLELPADITVPKEESSGPTPNTRIFDKRMCGSWKLDEGEGSICGDSSADPAQGNFVNPAREKAGNRFVAKLSGEGSFIEIPYREKFSTEAGNEVSVELLINRSDNSPAVLFMKRDDGAMPNYQVGINKDGYVFFGMRLGAVYGDTPGVRFPLKPGRWYHIACTYNSGEVKIYVNGKLDIVHWRGGIIKNSADKIWLGRNHGYPETIYFKGLMSGVKIYNYALSEEEIRNASGANPAADK